MHRPRLLVVFGTRPEAIKMAPVVAALRDRPQIATRVLATGQHPMLLKQALDAFGIVPDAQIAPSRAAGSLDAALAHLLVAIGGAMERERPQRVVVHGDTLTTLAATLSAHLRGIPVAHVEAGLRSGDLSAPWPEEGSRRVAGVLADLHLAPTAAAVAALRAENVPAGAIHLTGNTVADALCAIRTRIAAEPALTAGVEPVLARFAGKRIVTVTVHRRENHGAPLERIAEALARLAMREDIGIVVPLHPNPAVAGPLSARLGGGDRVALLPALDYPAFVRLMAASALILTDSGGVQEEAPALGVPVLVLRDVTERREGVVAGGVRVIGTQTAHIVAAAGALLDDPAQHAAMAVARDCYGDGHAARRIADILLAVMTGNMG
ncbi:MAG: UDP-N-acetylglucosamine 2-epimerase (non-hydrolyzing) [Sphingomonas phyllosphaerae]|uniref:non-hydrolyzing UDP-N-acetylglucosamine 2-epimerase n=1 Tax=Sphingomonas phyllosphaerae TaxID=257003 RepID=UPI002FF8849A